MPNGNRHFKEEELPVLEEFFSRIGDLLTKFADDFNLKIERYWHQMPSWRLNFKHPKGGFACIEVMKNHESEIKIYSYWWLDDFDKGTRHSRTTESDSYRLEDLQLYDLLRENLKLIVSWTSNEWTDISSGFQEAWKISRRKTYYGSRTTILSRGCKPTELFDLAQTHATKIPIFNGKSRSSARSHKYIDLYKLRE